MAAQIVADKFNYKMDDGGYFITEPVVRLIELP
jgi:hypothetical protein